MNVDKKAVVGVVLGQPWVAGHGRVCLARGESHLETWSVGVKSRLLYNQRAGEGGERELSKLFYWIKLHNNLQCQPLLSLC